MSDLDSSLAYDFTSARLVANLLAEEGITAVAEEYEIGMAHIRLDPEDDDPTGYIAVASAEGNDDSAEGGWVMVVTHYDKELHVYDIPDQPVMEPLGIPADADPEAVAEAITNFLK